MTTITENKILAKTQFIKLFDENNPFILENGEKLFTVEVAYQTYGELNSDRTNAILLCHALTGSANAAGLISKDELLNSQNHKFLFQYNEMNFGKIGWWNDLVGPNKTFDTNKYFVVCSNFLGGCYGTTGPTSINTKTNKIYGLDFPSYSIRDMVKLQSHLIKYLGINKLKTIAGGSLGGMQVLEWAIMFPDIVESIIPIATAAKHSDWAIGFNKLARQAIFNDPKWNNGKYESQPNDGLSLARMIAMTSYRSFKNFNLKFQNEVLPSQNGKFQRDKYQVENYLNYQGDKLVKRFDANTYLYITYAIDQHNVGRDRARIEDVLGNIKIPSLNIGISSDTLYPAEEQKEIASKIPNAKYFEIESIYGHDAFLIEFQQLNKIISEFLLTLPK
ncbi:MAG: homoserine O-acetyltransferase [Ignavibacterium sp.]